MEQLLHYCWKHKILPLRPLQTTDGRTVEVLNPGRHNRDAGPDFLDARVKIDGVLWAGSVEVHVRASDWHRHGHDGNPAYEHIILHIVGIDDERLTYPDGTPVPQVQLDVPQYVSDNYDRLLRADSLPRCKNVLGGIPKLLVHSWMSALQVERLELRMQQIMERRNQLDKNWEDTLFVTIARSFGFGKNGDAFEHWAYSIPMSAVGKHRDNLLQVEAIFFGQAGLLDDPSAAADDYFRQLQREYKFLRQKFSLTPIDRHQWKFLRLRPQNFPHIRIAQLAMMYYQGRLNLSRLLNADAVSDLKALLQTQVSDYWRTHYQFGSDLTPSSDKHLSDASMELLIINAVSPLLFSYARYVGNEDLAEHAVRLLETLKPEANSIIRSWREAGVQVENAADTQALLQLHTAYCLRHDCLRCRFGFEYIRRTPDFLREKESDG
ncbi:MAG: DUF2851 family protein [Bacteroidaceae bacterium]|nr:DUF2851 family protein [Bacteroidaceae bacterium]